MSKARSITLSEETDKMLEELCNMGIVKSPYSAVIEQAIIVFYHSIKEVKSKGKEEAHE